MKRIKNKLIKEFETLDIFRGRIFQIQYGELHYIRLMWTTRGRWISLHHRLSKTVKDYITIPEVPVPILRASIKFFQDYTGKYIINEKIKEKIGEKNS